MSHFLIPSDSDAAHTMRQSGTEFTKRLADAWFVAEPVDQNRLKVAFAADFERYRQLARLNALNDQVRAEALKAFDEHAPRIALDLNKARTDYLHGWEGRE